MIEDVKLIERMDKLLELGMGEESKNWSDEQNLYFVMGAVKGIKSNAERRLKEFEDAHEPRENNEKLTLDKPVNLW